jgi:hypothetical protein
MKNKKNIDVSPRAQAAVDRIRQVNKEKGKKAAQAQFLKEINKILIGK